MDSTTLLLLSSPLLLALSSPLLLAKAEVRCFCDLPQCVATGLSMCRSPSGVCVVEGGTRRACVELLTSVKRPKAHEDYCAEDEGRSTRLCCTEDLCNEDVAPSSGRFPIRDPGPPFHTSSSFPLLLLVGGLLLAAASARVRRQTTTRGIVQPVETRLVTYSNHRSQPVPDRTGCESVVSLGHSDIGSTDSSREKYFVFDA